MEGYDIDYLNENEFKKLEHALKKYNMLAFKKLNFEYYPSLRNGKFVGKLIESNKKDEIYKYELLLPSDKMFAQVHGEIKLFYNVYKKEHAIMLDTITPTEILLEGHSSELTTYKGIMISKANASKDKFKIDLLNMLQDNEYSSETTINNISYSSKKTNSLKNLQAKKQKLNNDIEDLEIKKINLMDDITELKARKEKLEKNLTLSSLDEKNLSTNKVSDNSSNKTNENDISFGAILVILIFIITIIFILTNL